MIALAGADHDDPEVRVGAYLCVEFLTGFRALLKGLSTPSKQSPKRHRV